MSLISKLTITILFASFSSTGISQAKKRASIDVEERIRTKRKPSDAPKPKRSSVFAVQVERKLIKGINKTVSYLNKTANSLPRKSPQRLDILERVLNLHLEQATYVRSEEERRYDSKWQAWEARGRKGREPVLNTRKSITHWKAVIRQATKILKEYPRAKTADVITYNQAIALQFISKEKQAAVIYNQLIKNYPNSDIVGAAYSSLGDYYFDRNDFSGAEKNYKKAIRYKRSNRYYWAIFKLGWCSYNLGRYSGALKYWKKLVRESKSAGSKNAIQLKEEALRDMVYAFAELKDVTSAIRYYKANAGTQFIGPFLNLLSQILSDQGQYKQAIGVLKKFQRIIPYDPGGPTAQKEIVALNYALGRISNVWKELSIFEKKYGIKSKWASRNPRKLQLTTQILIKDQMIYYSSITHQKAIKDGNKNLNKEARTGYKLFLANYPGSKEVPSIQFYIADIEYYLKNYRSAGKFYLQVASLGKKKALRYSNKTKKFENIHKQASIYMVDAYVKDFEPKFKVLQKQIPNFKKKPKPLSIESRNYIKACSKYMGWYPGDKKRKKSCEAGITKIYYHSGDKKNATRYLKLIATKYSTTKEGPAAVDLLITIVKDNKKDLSGLAATLLKIPSYRKGKMGMSLRSIQRGSEKASISKISNTLKRAAKYEEQARKYPNDSEVDKLWYNAAIDYTKGGNLDKAIEAYKVIVLRFPRKNQAQNSLITIAKIYEKQLKFDLASNYYLEYYKKYSKAKDAPGAFSRSCELLVAIESNKALKTCLGFANSYPAGSQVFIERLIENFEYRKKYNEMNRLIRNSYLRKYKLSPNQKIVAFNRIYKASRGQGSAAKQAAGSMFQVYNSNKRSVSGEALRYIGGILFAQNNQVMNRYRTVKLQGGSVDRLLKSMQNKAMALQKLEASYNKVVQSGDAYWSIAAYHQIGLANELFSLSMQNPPSITGATKEQVSSQLAPQVKEVKTNALNYYNTAAKTVSKYKVYNEWSIKTINSIARLSGQALTFSDELMLPDFAGIEIPTDMASEIKGEPN